MQFEIYVERDPVGHLARSVRDLAGHASTAFGATISVQGSAEDDAGQEIWTGQTAAARKFSDRTSPFAPDEYPLWEECRQPVIFGRALDGASNGIYSFPNRYLGVRWFMPGPPFESIPNLKDFRLPFVARARAWQIVPSAQPSAFAGRGCPSPHCSRRGPPGRVVAAAWYERRPHGRSLLHLLRQSCPQAREPRPQPSSRHLPVKPDVKCPVAAWAHADIMQRKKPPKVEATFLSRPEERPIRLVACDVLTTQDEWQRVLTLVRAPEQANLLGVHFNINNQLERMWVDDVSIQEIA